MSKKMLIDASHPEETRVVIVNGTRVEELDFESRNKRQLRGNVYLARVTRVEPSLQAAFVEYGGNRHGFLAFSEIHPDYYQIPYEDRMALLEDEEADHEEDEDEDMPTGSDEQGSDVEDAEHDENLDPDDEDVSDEADSEVAAEQVKVASKRRKRMSRRRYKIQEVIKRGQILLLQAVKEERGNKGAAMTSYLSLAGRYCVLMPNTPRGGGISRKIANGADRKRLKSIMSELEVPQGMGVIVRTAGGKRTKIEIKRDYDYLSRLWETIRETTLKSIAPALIHEEGNLVKRSIRDMYNKDIDEVLVQGEDAYKTAKDFIKMLMPSHAKNVKAYKDKIPLFLRYQVERQIEASLDSVVQLKSGGYLVIHPTEALVSVDVNSGRSTRERNIERTALKTNLEAAEEVARQMRLRDLAGLIVIDFIDMDEHKNNRAVEKRMKECLSLDRARVQTDRISQFGLMEISRQRRRRSLLEGSTTSCEHCEGVGRKRTVESSALVAIRAVEEIGARRQVKRIRLKVSPDVAIYIFNEKRDLLQRVDDEFDMFTELVGDDTLIRPSFIVDSLENREKEEDPLLAIEEEQKRDAKNQSHAKKENSRRRNQKEDDDEASDEELNTTNASISQSESETDTDENGEPRKRRRRRGRRGGRGKRSPEAQNNDAQNNSGNSDISEDKAQESPNSDGNIVKSENTGDSHSEEIKSKPRRSRGRRKAPSRKGASDMDESAEETSDVQINSVATSDDAPKVHDDKPRSTARRKAPAKRSAKAAEISDDTSKSAPSKPRRKSRGKMVADTQDAQAEDFKSDTASTETGSTKTGSIKTGSTKTGKSSRRRKAPTKTDAVVLDTPKDVAVPKATKTSKSKTAPASAARRKAPVKKTIKPSKTTSNAETKTPSENRSPARRKAPTKATAKATAKTSARRAAPGRKTVSDDSTSPADLSPRKTAAKKTAAKKPIAKKSVAKKSAKKTATTKRTTAKKPTAKASNMTASSVQTTTDAKSRARRKAPARKSDAPVASKPDPEPGLIGSVAPVQDKPVSQMETAISEPQVEKKPKKKRGWLSRLTKGD